MATTPTTARSGHLQPILMAVLGIGLLSLMDAAVKQVSATVPTWQIVLLRYAFGTVFALPLFLAGGLRLPARTAMRAHLLRSIAIVLTAATFFYALSVLPLAVTLALSFTSPILIALLARLSLRERPPRRSLPRRSASALPACSRCWPASWTARAAPPWAASRPRSPPRPSTRSRWSA